jgi:hypothetical protein
MAVIPFIGPSYTLRNRNYDNQRLVNMFMVRGESGNSKSATYLSSTPGLKTLFTLPLFPIRNAWRAVNRAFFVAGNTLYESFIDGTYQPRGQLNSSNGFVGMSDNGTELIMVDGPDGYIFNLNTNTFTQITSVGFLGSNTVTFIDGFFVLSQPFTGIIYNSGLYDWTCYNQRCCINRIKPHGCILGSRHIPSNA